MKLQVEKVRGGGRPQRQWNDCIQDDFKEKELKRGSIRQQSVEKAHINHNHMY